MRYLTFDIECCDGKHICEFGYVITDEKFNIIKKSVITINPESKFNLVGRPGSGICVYLFHKSSIITVRFLRHIMTTLKTYWNILSRLLWGMRSVMMPIFYEPRVGDIIFLP